jgi:hypothetical protein
MKLKVPPSRFAVYFIAILLPLALVLSALIVWHNSVITELTPLHLLIRALVAMITFLVGGLVFMALVLDRR